MNPSEFIDFAGRLSASDGGSAPQYRSAISRAYYGAFHIATQFLEGIGHPCKMANEHKWPVEALGNSGVAEAIEISGLLHNLRVGRRDADYNLDNTEPESPSNAKLGVERASEIRSKIAACAASRPLRERITKGIADHKRRIPGR